MTKNKRKVWVWPPLTSSQLFPSERDLVIWTRDIDEQNGGGGGYYPIKVTEVLVRKLREHPLKVPESCFMGMSQIHFHP